MAGTAGATQSGAIASFASVLAGLASKGDGEKDRWSLEDLEEDVATLSYEQALRSHARGSRLAGEDASPPADVAQIANPVPAVGKNVVQGRKTASITLRMSDAECTELHGRAAEAGMTVSAYLRSCIFEAENLRAQVKETLAQFRAGSSEGLMHPASARQAETHRWQSRFFSHWGWNKRSANA